MNEEPPQTVPIIFFCPTVLCSNVVNDIRGFPLQWFPQMTDTFVLLGKYHSESESPIVLATTIPLASSPLSLNVISFNNNQVPPDRGMSQESKPALATAKSALLHGTRQLCRERGGLEEAGRRACLTITPLERRQAQKSSRCRPSHTTGVCFTVEPRCSFCRIEA